MRQDRSQLLQMYKLAGEGAQSSKVLVQSMRLPSRAWSLSSGKARLKTLRALETPVAACWRCHVPLSLQAGRVSGDAG